jgi:hypothetical protein
MSATIDQVLAAWARVGAGFNVQPAADSPDLERLLIQSARLAPESARLFTLCVTWLTSYGHLIARHRLRQLIIQETDVQTASVLGLLLDIVRLNTGTRHFNQVIEACASAPVPGPLFRVEQINSLLRERAHRRASEISKQWGLWTEPILIKHDAILPPFQVALANPAYRDRADLGGDLRCSILETLRCDPHAGCSELAMARACGVTRMAVRSALEKLTLAGRITRPQAAGRARPILLAATAA